MGGGIFVATQKHGQKKYMVPAHLIVVVCDTNIYFSFEITYPPPSQGMFESMPFSSGFVSVLLEGAFPHGLWLFYLFLNLHLPRCSMYGVFTYIYQ